MQGKEVFFRVIRFIKELGICPICNEKGHLSKSGISSYHCSGCECNSIIEKDKLIMQWYIIDEEGRRVLKSREIFVGEVTWTNLLKDIRQRIRQRKLR